MSKLHAIFLLTILHSIEITLMLKTVLKEFRIVVPLVAGRTAHRLATYFRRVYTLPLSHAIAWHRQDSVFIERSVMT